MSYDFFQLATPAVQALQPYQPGKPIEELKREYGIKNIVKLASNENPLGLSERAKVFIQAHLQDLTRYPDGNGFALKKSLAQKYQVETEMITLGNGSNELLELIARTFVTTENSIIYSQYSFPVYALITQALGAKHLQVPAKNWGHDLIAMQQAINSDTRLIFIANPNNPTGTWIDKLELQTFLKQVPESVIVVVDEAYFEYASVENPAYPDSLQWLKDFPNLVVMRTFSKAYGLAGLRVGYAISQPNIAHLLNRVRQPFNVNSLALVAANCMLADNDYLKRSIAINQVGMQQLTTAFKRLNLAFIPSLGNFVAVNVGNAMEVYEKLLRCGVITRPIANMPNYLRVSIGLEAENDMFLEALQNYIL